MADLRPVIRAVWRILVLNFWTLACSAILLATSGASLLFRGLLPVRQEISRLWMRIFLRVIGTRLVVHGHPPASPFFFVVNHVCWLDFFVINSLCRGRAVLMAEADRFIILRRLFRALDPIYVQRVRSDTPRVKALIVEALKRRESVLLAPEAASFTGRDVRRFHAGLLEAAVLSSMAVSHGAITYRTPAGWPPPSECLIFPDPYFEDSRALAEDSSKHTPQLFFLRRLFQLCRLPYHEAAVTFGATPVTANDSITLANSLEQAVRANFTPVE